LHDQTVNLARAVSVFQIEGVEPIAETGEQDDDEFAQVERRAAGSPMRGARPVLEHRSQARRRA
jgi:methyl-accepting chemotaxis protein